MKQKFTFVSAVFLLFVSCTKPSEEILPLVGVYRAHILGVAGPFDLIISTDRSNNIFIEAPFDGAEWYIVKAKVSNTEREIKDIKISSQDLDCCTSVSGSGFHLDRTIELNFTLRKDGVKSNFKLVGTK